MTLSQQGVDVRRMDGAVALLRDGITRRGDAAIYLIAEFLAAPVTGAVDESAAKYFDDGRFGMRGLGFAITEAAKHGVQFNKDQALSVALGLSRRAMAGRLTLTALAELASAIEGPPRKHKRSPRSKTGRGRQPEATA